MTILHFYDRLNRVIKIKDPAGNYTYYDYDENGNRTAVRDPRSSGPTDNTYKTAYTYDDNDRLTRTDYPDGTYETTTYDEVGNVTGKTDQKGQSTTYQYDNANHLTKITYHDTTTTEFTYDAAGRTLSRKDPDGSNVYFQSIGSMAREYRLDSGGDLVYDYYTVYDDDGRVDKFLDCTEATIAKYNLVKYNENVNKIGYLATTILGQNFKYGENKKYREGTTDSRIKWGKIKLGSGGIQYAASSGVQITGYNYDDNGNLLSFTDPFGKTYRFENSWRKSRTYYPNNTYAEREFDQYGRLSAINHKRTETDGSETTLESFSYQYDDNGNITKITYANGEYTDYTYDSLDRLTIEEKKTSGGASIYKIEYKFDNNDAKNGNIHQVIVNDADMTTFTYNEMNQLTNITHPDSSTETLNYDDNGNLTQTSHNGEITSYQWDCNDRLTKVTNPDGEITEFTYDSDGMLVKEESSGMERKFIQHNRYATRELTKNDRGEWEPTARHIIYGTMLSTYISPTSSNHPKSKSKNQNNRSDNIFYHTDHLGSVRLITDRNGNIIDSISTDAYGNPLPHADSTGGKGAKMLQEFNFVGTHGIRYVGDIKLQNMRARWYSTINHRFISYDTIEGDNRYRYTSNPLLFIDPSGNLQIFHLYSEGKELNKFKKYSPDGKNYLPKGAKYLDLPFRQANLLDVLAKSHEDHTIIYIYTHANVYSIAGMGWSIYFDPKYKIENITYSEKITWRILKILLRKREHDQLQIAYDKRTSCYKFLWVLINACTSGKVPWTELALPNNIEQYGKEGNAFLNYIKKTNTIVYSGWDNFAGFNEVMPHLIYDVITNNQELHESEKNYPHTPPGKQTTYIINTGYQKHGKTVSGEWFTKDKKWW